MTNTSSQKYRTLSGDSLDKGNPGKELFIGAPRDASCRRTVKVITDKIKRMAALKGFCILDVGCGEGSFTEIFGQSFSEVYGIDVQTNHLDSFRARVRGQPGKKYLIASMDASAMDFPEDFFDTIISIETLEHVPRLKECSSEIARVIKPKGQLVLTVPNRWFPFENHGAQIGRWRLGRVPLLTYLPFLHKRYALARVFSLKDLIRLFEPLGFKLEKFDYAWPTFEHEGNPLQALLRPFFPLMRLLESSPLKFFGTSIIAKFVKIN